MINFSDKENLNNLITIEQSSLNATLGIQRTLNMQILTFIKSCVGNVNISPAFDPSDSFMEYVNKSSSILNKSNNNITSLKKMISKLDKLLPLIKDLSQKELQLKIENYNNQFKKNIDKIYKNTEYIEKFIHEISFLDVTELSKKFNLEKQKQFDTEKSKFVISSSDLDSSFVENTLIISEIQQKVILPYTIEEIKDILLTKKKEFSSVQDVIDKLYTKPISDYKIPSISRFKETYNLVIKNKNGSKFKAFSLALEMFMNYNLHPAIITACKSIDELDIYLACLETNTLDDFNYFDVKFEIPPSIIAKDVVD